MVARSALIVPTINLMCLIPMKEENDSSSSHSPIPPHTDDDDHYREGRLLGAFVIFRFVLFCFPPVSITTKLHQRLPLLTPRCVSFTDTRTLTHELLWRGCIYIWVHDGPNDLARLWGSPKVSGSSECGFFTFSKGMNKILSSAFKRRRRDGITFARKTLNLHGSRLGFPHQSLRCQGVNWFSGLLMVFFSECCRLTLVTFLLISLTSLPSFFYTKYVLNFFVFKYVCTIFFIKFLTKSFSL